jgi:hypothetical protein
MEKLTGDNFKKGFLMDEELMAGISEVPDAPGSFTAYVVRHTTGETLGTQQFGNIFEAIRTLNEIPREWAYQSVSKCGGGNCKAGGCGKNGGGCGKKNADSVNEAGADQNADQTSSCSTGNC